MVCFDKRRPHQNDTHTLLLFNYEIIHFKLKAKHSNGLHFPPEILYQMSVSVCGFSCVIEQVKIIDQSSAYGYYTIIWSRSPSAVLW